ncbi:hypothetical protein [Alcanivorax sp.]|uniref:hypothetical protein n=2 Tax=Gammaproteobacteria TaxID=1236 RepID=UPI003A914F69
MEKAVPGPAGPAFKLKMDYFMSRYLLTIILSSIIFPGCAVNPSSDAALRSANQALEDQFSPFRYMATPSDSGGSIAHVEWAGVPGQSISERAPQVRQDIFGAIMRNCDLQSSALAETRIVKHEVPTFYEVWVFNDPLSERTDKKSGLAVVMKQLPNGGGVDIQYYGDCHSKEAPAFHFSN